MARQKKTDDDDEDIMGTGNNAAANAELLQFVERHERLDQDARAIAEDKKELMKEAKGRGYDTKVLRKVLAIRKKNADELAEENALLETYLFALGMI